MMTMAQAATAYARMGAPETLVDKRYVNAARIIAKAMTSHPMMVNGDGEFCTELMRVTQGKVLGKVGGEGVYMVSLPNRSLGISLKIADGNERAVYPVVVETLHRLNLITAQEFVALRKWHTRPVKDHHGQNAGTMIASVAYDGTMEVGSQCPQL